MLHLSKVKAAVKCVVLSLFGVAFLFIALLSYNIVEGQVTAEEMFGTLDFAGFFVFAVLACAVEVVYYSKFSVKKPVNSSEKNEKKKSAASSGVKNYKTFPAGCKVETESGKSEHSFDEPIIVIFPDGYVDVVAPEEQTAQEEESCITYVK